MSTANRPAALPPSVTQTSPSNARVQKTKTQTTTAAAGERSAQSPRGAKLSIPPASNQSRVAKNLAEAPQSRASHDQHRSGSIPSNSANCHQASLSSPPWLMTAISVSSRIADTFTHWPSSSNSGPDVAHPSNLASARTRLHSEPTDKSSIRYVQAGYPGEETRPGRRKPCRALPGAIFARVFARNGVET